MHGANSLLSVLYFSTSVFVQGCEVGGFENELLGEISTGFWLIAE